MPDGSVRSGARARVAQLLGGLLPGSGVGSFIAGEIVPGTGESLDLVNPADGGVILSYADAGAPVVAQAMTAARAAQPRWWGTTAAARGRGLWDVARLVRANADA